MWEGGSVVWDEPQRRVAPGQTVALYDGDRVLGAGLAASAVMDGLDTALRR